MHEGYITFCYRNQKERDEIQRLFAKVITYAGRKDSYFRWLLESMLSYATAALGK